MNEEVKRRWVEALRSGEYQQASGYLRTGIEGYWSYCCLGVLCDIAVKDGVVGWAHGDTSGVSACDGSASYLPARVVDWAGLSSFNPMMKSGSQQQDVSLVAMNDDFKYDFEQIADAIESGL